MASILMKLSLSDMNMITILIGILPPTPSSSKCNMTCREDFYCDDFNNLCTPICPDWEIFGPSATTAFRTCIWICSIIGTLCGIGVLIMYGLRFKQ